MYFSFKVITEFSNNINAKRLLLGMLSILQGVPSYAVFFSPSGVNFTAEIGSSFTKWWSRVEVL